MLAIVAGATGVAVAVTTVAPVIVAPATGLVMLNVDAFWQFIVVGAVVIIAVLIDQSRELIVGRGKLGRFK